MLAVAAATPLPAQSPLLTTFAHDNTGAPGGMVFFDLTVATPNGITWTGLDCNTSAASGALEVWVVPGGYLANAANPSAWTLAATGQLIGAGSGQPTWMCLSPPIALAAGNHGIAIAGPGVAHHYTVGLPGVPLVYGNADLTLSAGAACNEPFLGVQYAPRVWNGALHYQPGSTAGLACATSSVLGRGCIDGAVSFYEVFDGLGAFDLGGSTALPVVLQAIAAGPVGYAVQPVVGSWWSPTGTPLLGNALAVPLRDDDVSEVLPLPFVFPFPGGSTNVVQATSNGEVLLGATTATTADLLPTSNKLLTGAPRLCALWCDLHASANVASNPLSGVYFDVVPGAQQVVITWLDVADGRAGTPLPGATSISMQCALSVNGDVEFRYAAVQPGPGLGRVLVGVSPGAANGAAARDPGGRDLSAGYFATDGPDSFPLVHGAGLLRLGGTCAFAVDGADGLLPSAFLALGLGASPAPVDLTPLGAPGCWLTARLDAVVAMPLDAAWRAGELPLAVPATAALAGAALHSQVAALTSRNGLGLVTSNSIEATIGW